jgi:hypothetical protein
MNATETASMANTVTFKASESPAFYLANSIPQGMNEQFASAICDFMESSNLPYGIDKQGFFNQTLQAIANSALLGQGRELWLGIKDNTLYTYILAGIGVDFDGRLAYTVSQAWVKEDQRGQPWVKDAWEKVRQRAQDTLCSHFAVHSTKANTEAYCRFLGKGFHKISEILKEEL